MNTQLLNKNYLKALVKVSFLKLVTNIIADRLNIKSVAEFKTAKFDND